MQQNHEEQERLMTEGFRERLKEFVDRHQGNLRDGNSNINSKEEMGNGRKVAVEKILDENFLLKRELALL